MKKISSIIILTFLSAIFAFAEKNREEDKELKTEATKISRELSLNANQEHLVYNVLCHVKARIADVPVGHEKYEKLIGYVDEERISMMKALMTVPQYKQYDAVFGKSEKQKIEQLVAKNAEYVKTYGVLINKVTGADLVDDQFFDQVSEDDADDPDDNANDANKAD